MIRLELFVFLGIGIGIAATLLVQWVWAKISKVRESRIVARAKAEALKVRIDDAHTNDLLEEISTRDDLTASRATWDIPPVPDRADPFQSPSRTRKR